MKQQVVAEAAPKADHLLSQAIISGGFIFVAGQVHNKPDGALVMGFVKEKLEQIMTNIKTILQAADADLDDVVKVTIYVTDMAQMAQLNQEYPNYFSSPLPAREAVCVKELPLGATVEISVIAEVK